MSAPLLRPLPRRQASRTLVGISFCGGGTAPLRPWARSLPEDVEAVLYCAPGREGRFTVPYACDWDALLDDALAALRTLSTRPYTLMGHSMGAWVAFDLAVRAEHSGLRPPEAVVASAAISPTLHRQAAVTPPRANESDDALLNWLSTTGQLAPEVQAEPELVGMALEVFRADLLVSDSYRYRLGDSVSCPLRVLYGEDDTIDAAGAERWRHLTRGDFSTVRLPGGHFYTPQVWDRLPDYAEAHTDRTEGEAAIHPVTARF